MKKKLLISLAMFLAVGTSDIYAQSFLKKLEETAKKEVGNRVKKEVEKYVSKTTASKSSDSNIPTTQSQSQSDDIFSLATKRVSVTTLATMVEYGPTAGKLNGHEWVDLGLPSGTRWATCNVDATAPEQSGKHYSWGETAIKTSYVAENTKTYSKEMSDISGNQTYDVAAQKWGKGWRLPTEEELRELINYSNDKYVQKGGRWGREFVSVMNNQSIFLPATGSKEGSKLQEANGCGLYWTSTPYTNNHNNGAHMYTFGAALGEMSIGERYSGFAVRPVTDYDLNTEIPYDGETNGHKWVDLGLPSGLKWATYNLGSDAVDQDGGYYRWGAITTYYEGEKYAKDEVNKDITGDASYDAASAHWGSAWHMPTVGDFVELMENCTWEWTNIGRRKGLKVTSKHNGKYIFLPASGEMNYNCASSRLSQDINKKLFYWTSSYMPGWQNASEAYLVSAFKDEVYITQKGRGSYGFCIRPVTK